MLTHLPDLEEALALFRGQEPIVLGDINMDLDEDQNPCSQIFAELMTEFSLIDLMHHFWQHLCFLHLCTGAEHIPGSSRLMRWWDQVMEREAE